VGRYTVKGDLREKAAFSGVEWFVPGVGQTLIKMGTFSKFRAFLGKLNIHQRQEI